MKRYVIAVLLFLLLLSGCGSLQQNPSQRYGVDVITHEGYEFPATLGEPVLSEDDIKGISISDRERKLTTLADLFAYLKSSDKTVDNSKSFSDIADITLFGDYEEGGTIEIDLGNNEKYYDIYFKSEGKFYPVDGYAEFTKKKKWMQGYKGDTWSFDDRNDMISAIESGFSLNKKTAEKVSIKPSYLFSEEGVMYKIDSNSEQFPFYKIKDVKIPYGLGFPVLTDADLLDVSRHKNIRMIAKKINSYPDLISYIIYNNGATLFSDLAPDRLNEALVEILSHDYEEVGRVNVWQEDNAFFYLYIKSGPIFYLFNLFMENRKTLGAFRSKDDIEAFCFDNPPSPQKVLRVSFDEVFYEGFNDPNNILNKDENYDWNVEDAEADSLETIELTIQEIQEKANAIRRDNYLCKTDTYYGSTSRQDAQAISAEEASRIKISSFDIDDTYLSTMITKEEAKEDAQIYADIIKSTYGPYYLTDVSVWEKALSDCLEMIDSYDKETISGEEFADILMQCYAFVKDAHYRFAGVSPMEKNDEFYYYFYCEDLDFYKDARGYFTKKKNKKWYLSQVNGDADLEAYIKPTITESGRLAYQIGTFLHSKDDTKAVLTLTRGGETILYETEYIKSTTLKEMAERDDVSISQSGVYEDYYVLSIRGFDARNNTEVSYINNYVDQARYLRGMSNFIIDSRGNGGGPGNPKITRFYEYFTGGSFSFNVSETIRFSRISNNSSTNYMDTISRKQNGTYYYNKNLFVYLVDKDVASSGENGIYGIKQMDNALLVGTNSLGCQIGSFNSYFLPNSKVVVSLGPSLRLQGNSSIDIEGLGIMPDIYVDGYLALDRVIMMYKYYGLEPDAGVGNLKVWGDEIPLYEN